MSNDVELEQNHLSMLYGHLDDLRERAQRRLAETRLSRGGTHQALSERDSMATMLSDQIDQYNAVEHGLCFGRVDGLDGTVRYIGRLGLYDEKSGEHRPGPAQQPPGRSRRRSGRGG